MVRFVTRFKTNHLLLLFSSSEIRAYSHRNKLDNSNAKILSVDHEVQLLSLYQNRLLALCSDGTIYLYDLHLFKRNHHYSTIHHRHSHHQDSQDYDLNISAPIRVILNNLEIFPDCVTLCLLTDLHVDMYNSSIFNIHHTLSIPSSSTTTLNESISHRVVKQNPSSSSSSRSHSILINICGRVLLLEMDIDTSKLPPFSFDDEDDDNDVDGQTINHSQNGNSNKSNNNRFVNAVHTNGSDNNQIIRFKKVVKLASNVENLWLLPHDDVQLQAFLRSSQQSDNMKVLSQQQLRPHLETSLYLSCGCHGMAIWLSLEHSIRPYGSSLMRKSDVNKSNNDNEHTYISKRIMLPFQEIGSAIYPLAIRFREAIVLGAESDFTQPNFSTLSQQQHNNSQQLFSVIPYFVVKRTSQVYLHYILRELLRRNLGYRAWEIANTCSTLPHFVHSLELLLHGVLEEEASSSQPIPDALLPRVVDFIRAFPVFLQTVIHCARKTELALWPHLFSIVGSPKDLFQQCILEGQLDTASSYIIVLQNLEKPEVASKCVSRLLQAARVAGCWVTVKELKRFLRATNQTEENQDPTSDNSQHQTRTRSNSVQHSYHHHQPQATDKLEEMSVPLSAPIITGTNHNGTSLIIGSGNNRDSRKPMISDRTKSINRAMPGRAAMSSTIDTNQPMPDKCCIEENVEINENLNHGNNDIKEVSEDCSLNNFDDRSTSIIADENNEDQNNGAIISDIDKFKMSNHCNGTIQNCRAYPGTIMRMTSDPLTLNGPDKKLNQTLKFLSISETNSSASSIMSSSCSSSTISSASISFSMTNQQQKQMQENHHHHQSMGEAIKENNHHEHHRQLRPLRSVSIGQSSNNHEQCTIF